MWVRRSDSYINLTHIRTTIAGNVVAVATKSVAMKGEKLTSTPILYILCLTLQKRKEVTRQQMFLSEHPSY